MSGSLSLVPVTDGRPAVVFVQGCAIRVDVRDADVRATERVFTQQLMDAHPDRGGTAALVRRVLADRAAFRRDTAKEYARLGVPPLVAVRVRETKQIPQTRCACGRWFPSQLIPGGTQNPATRRQRKFCSNGCPERQAMRRAPRGRPGVACPAA